MTIPDASLDRIVDGVCAAYEFSRYVESGGTMNKNQFAKQILIDFVKQTVRNYEGNIEAEAARIEVIASIDAINIT